MKLYKQVDWCIQLTLVVGTTLYFSFFDKSYFIAAYFIVGGWQLLSCLIHRIYERHYLPANERRQYLKIILWVLIITAGSAALVWLEIFPFIFISLFGLLFFSPILALWYLHIFRKEIKLLLHRFLVHLK